MRRGRMEKMRKNGLDVPLGAIYTPEVVPTAIKLRPSLPTPTKDTSINKVKMKNNNGRF